MNANRLLLFIVIIFSIDARKSLFDILFRTNKDIPTQSITNSQESINKSIKVPILEKAFKTLDIPIRVLLSEQSGNFVWEIRSSDGFTAFIDNGTNKYGVKKFAGDSLIFKRNGNINSLSGINLVTKKIFLVPNSFIDKNINLSFNYNSVSYDGICVIVFNELHNSWNLVNYLDLEDYVASVIFGESWPGWPDEVNKALSICYRTYGISKVLEKKKTPYDIKNSNHHQVYKGSFKPEKFKKIVESTKNVVVSWQNKPILAMFDIACGNIIPGKKLGLDFVKAPYLGRNYACNYCKNYVYSKWEVAYTLDEVNNIFNNVLNKPGKIRDIIVSKKDKSGCITEINASINYKWVPISARQFKSAFKKLKSINFTVKKNRDKFIFTGRGYGHLTGLCQRGALQMVMLGYSYQDILKFYYPKTDLQKLISNMK